MANTGSNPNATGPKQNASARWLATVDGNDRFGETVVANGTVYTSGEQGVRALDNETGTTRWNTSAFDAEDLSVAGDTVYVTGERNYDWGVFAYDATSGTELWNDTLSSVEMHTPRVANGTLYVDYENRIRAYDAETGQFLWYSDSYDDGAPGGIAVSGDTVYLPVRIDSGGTLSALVALSATDGTEQWRFEVDGEIETTPTVANGTVYVGKGDEGTTDDPDPRLYALDPTDGSIEWVYDAHADVQGIAVANGSVYAATGNSVRALSEASGELAWTFNSDGNDYYGATTNPPAVADGVVYVTNDRGNVHGVDATTGEQRWWYGTGGVPVAPVVSDDKLYVRVHYSSGWIGSRVYALEENPFSFSGLSATPSSVEPGQSVTVEVTIQNDDSETRDYNVSLIDDRPHVGGERSKGNESGSLASGASTTVSFTTSFNVTGEHDLSIRRELDTESDVGPVSVTVEHASPDRSWATMGFNVSGSNANEDGIGAKRSLQEVWNLSADDDYDPVTVNGTTYLVDKDGNQNDLIAFDEVTGTERWRYNTSVDERQIFGSPAATDDLVFLTTFPYNFDGVGEVGSNATIYAIYAANGSKKWTRKLAIDTGYDQSGGDSAPLVADGTVFVAGADREDESARLGDYDAYFYAIDAGTGAIDWTYSYGTADEDERAHFFAVGADHVFLQVDDEDDDSGTITRTYELHAIDRTTHGLAWSTTDVGQRDPVLAGDGYVYVANNSGSGQDQALVAYHAANGTEAWRLEKPYGDFYDADVGNLALYDGHLYVDQYYYGSSYRTDRLFKLEPATGAKVWNRTIADANNMVIVDGLLYAGGFDFSDTFVYDATTGEYLGDSDMGAMLNVANGTLYTYIDTTAPAGNRYIALRSGARIVLSDMQVSANPSIIDENVTISATATNVGTLTRTFDTNLQLTGSLINDYYAWGGTTGGNENTLAPGESTTVSYVVEFRKHGDFTVSIEPDYHGDNGGSPSQDTLDQYLYDEAGNMTISVGDDHDGSTVSLSKRTASVTADSWPTSGLDDANSRHHGSTTGPTAVGGSEVVKWNNTDLEYGWTTPPTVVDDRVYVGGDDYNRDDYLYAINATDGSIEWGYESTDELISAPTYADGFVYFGDNDGRLYSVNTTTGHMLWSFSGGDVMGAPTVVDGVVYFGTDDAQVYALNASTRDVLWSTQVNGDVDTSPAISNDVVYVSTYDDRVYALNASTGIESWNTTLQNGYDTTAAVLDGDTLYVGNSVRLYALNATDGSIEWDVAADLSGDESDFPSTPAYADGTVYFGDDETGQFRAVDAATGSDVWRYTICSPIDSSPAVVDDVVYFGANDGVVYALDASTGDDVWNLQVVHGDPSYPVVYSPAVVDGVAYVSTDHGDDYPSLLALAGGSSNATADPFSLSGLSVNRTNTSVGGAITVSATVSNSGESACDYTAGLEVDGNETGNSTVSVSGGSSDTVSISHTFDAAGTYDVAIGDLSPIQVNVSGPQPEIDLSTTSVDFGDVNQSESVYKFSPFYVGNDGNAPLSVTGMAITGPDAGAFSVSGTTSATIQPGDDEWMSTLRVQSGTVGEKNATLEIYSNDSDEATVTVSLSATVVGPPEVDVSPASHDFGDVEVGNTSTTNVTVSNVGGGALSVDVASPTGSGSSAYSITAGSGTTTVAAGGDHNVTVEFAPGSTGSADATIELTTNDSDEPTVTVTLSGNGSITTPNRAPIAAADHYTVYEGEWLNVSAPGRLANDLDPDNDTFSASHHGDVDNGTLYRSAQDGSFNYLPDSGFTGTDSYVYRVRDSEGDYSSFARVTIEVVPDPNREPEAIDDHYSVHAGEWLNVSGLGRLANDRDPDNDTFRASHHGDVDHGTLHRSAQDGSFNYKADPWYTGTDSYVYRIRDAEGEYSQFATVTIEVLPPRNRAPTAVADHYSVSEGEWLNVSGPGRLANDYDVDGDGFDASHHGDVSHGTLHRSAQDGSFEYKPDPGFTGTDSYVYRIRDDEGEYSSFATVTIEVVDENRPPTVVDDNYATRKGEWLNVSGPGRLANDYDVDNDSFAASHHGSPSHGTLHRSAQDGSLQYLPDPGFTGTDSYVYRIRDDEGEYSGFGTVNIEVVDPAGTAPVAIADNYTVYEGETLTVNAPGRLANDVDPNNDSFAASHHGDVDNGTLHRSSQDGSFQYTPDPGFTGTDSYVYRIQDDNGAYSAFARVTIEVLPDPDTTGNRAPTVVEDTYTVFEGEWLNVTGPGRLANDYDPDGDGFSASHHGDVDNGTLYRSAQDGSFNYLPDPGFTGTDSYVYRVRDDHGEYSTFGTVTIEVVPHPNATGNRPPVAIDDRYSVYEGEWLNVSGPGRLANDRDPDGDSFAASHHGLTSHGTLHYSAQDGSFQYLPDTGFTGTDSYVYRVRDSEGEYSSFATVTIEVLPDPNRAPTAVADDYVVLQGETLSVSGPGRLANDYDPDGDSFAASHHGDVDNGTLHRSAQDGSLQYTPDPGFTGVDSYVYRIRDDEGEYSAFETVTITVVDGSISGHRDVVVATDSIDFGSVPAGTDDTATITVANIGDQNLTVFGAMLSGPNASDFEVIAGNASTVLGYGGSHALTVEYAPSAVGTADATLTVLSDDPDEPQVDVSLSGQANDDEAPTVHAVDLTGTHHNGSVVYTNESVDVEVNVTDAFGSIDDVDVTLDSRFSSFEQTADASYDGTSGNWTASFASSDVVDDGQYDVVVTASDDRANDAEHTASDRVEFDRDSPALAASVTRLNATAANVTVEASESLRTGSLTVDVERPDGTSVPVSMTDEGSSWNGTFSLLGDGQYALSATGVDLAGNRGSDDSTAVFANESTVNNTITVQIQPSGLFVRFNTNRSVNDTFITMTENKVPVAPLVRGQTGVNFLDAVLGKRLTANLTYATIGIPVDPSLLPSGVEEDDVAIRYFNETRRQWTKVPTTVENRTINGTTDRYWIADVTHFSTYGAVAADTSAPTLTSMSPAADHEFDAGTTTATLRVEFDDGNSGVDASEIVVTYDDADVTDDSATQVTSRYVEYDATGLTDGSNHELAVTVEDEAGNDATFTQSISVASESQASPSSSGSGGGESSGDGTSVVTPPSTPTSTPTPSPTTTSTSTPTTAPPSEPPTTTRLATKTTSESTTATATTTETPGGLPGFTLVHALLAVLASVLLWRSRRGFR